MASNKTIQIPQVIPNDWVRLRIIIDKLKHLRIGGGSTPEFANVRLTELTASSLLMTDANKELASISSPLDVQYGGIGVGTLTDHGILLGSGTGAVTPLGAATDGQLPIGSTGLDPVLATLTGTTNRVTVANAAGGITLSGPQDIHTGASVTFANVTNSALTQNRIVLAGASGLLADNANLTFASNTLSVNTSLEVNSKFKITTLGGLAIKLTNTTGAVTVAGQLVTPDPTTDDAVELSAVGEYMTIGVFLDDGIADDAEAWVVVAGIADVMFDDNHGPTAGDVCEASEAGYADSHSAVGGVADHWKEVGHCIETVAAGGGGTHVKARCVLHFN